MSRGAKQKIWGILLLGVILVWMEGLAEAASVRGAVNKANDLFEEGAYADSIEKYREAVEKSPEDGIINFDLGTAYYKTQEYGKAIEHLQKALLAEDDDLKQKAHYNLGNALYQQGIGFEESQIDAAVAHLEKSVSSYESAIDLNAKDQDAQDNHAFVKEELARLQEKQKQQQQQKNQSCPFPKKDGGSKPDRQPKDSGETSDEKPNQQGASKDQSSSEDQAQKQDAQRAQSQDESQNGKENPAEGDSQENEDAAQPQSMQGASSTDQGEEESGAVPMNADELTEEQAQQMLQKYIRNEEPKGFLNFYRRKAHPDPVLKDW